MAGNTVGGFATECFVQIGNRAVEFVLQQVGVAAIGKSVCDFVVGNTGLADDVRAQSDGYCGISARAVIRFVRRRDCNKQRRDHERYTCGQA